jgi:hypothetical protein
LPEAGSARGDEAIPASPPATTRPGPPAEKIDLGLLPWLAVAAAVVLLLAWWLTS